ncbi:MAG: Ni/Fe hydrogenase subunit alpha [Planctomycetota bacterium]|nr:MAG: Ni/Fe hydrogenase subunit alpha [Planctomycetota bacterium]
MTGERRIRVPALSRVEGEGGLFVRIRGDRIDEVKLTIYEPPRLFEAFLRGRPLEDVPDITARICGICPVAYQMSSTHALEAALGVSIIPEIRTLRRLLYCGEWIESHCLHIHLLHAPDFFGADSGIELARRFPDEVARGLRLKKLGNELLEVLGGRAIHPINVAVGGFYRVPRREPLLRLLPEFERGLEAAVEMTRWVASFDFPDYTRPYEMVALQHPDEYPMNEGDVASTNGLRVPVAEYERQFEEFQVPHSTALHSGRVDDHRAYHVGPLARVNLNRNRLSPTARRLADEVGLEHPCRNPFRAIVARALEVVHAFEEAIGILRAYRPFTPSRVAYEPRAGGGCAATEAPRGLLYHRYALDDRGLVTFAKIVPPTSQNQRQMEEDLRDWLPLVLGPDDAETALQCERLVRCYDPCISCSTHFLTLTVARE